MTIRHITSETFERDVLNWQRPTLVDFCADWSGSCRAMGSVVDELENDFQARAYVVKVNVGESPELARRFGVQSIPTLIAVRDGEAAERFVGVQAKQTLTKAVAA